jgi:tRNA(Ile)-lysidine synthase
MLLEFENKLVSFIKERDLFDSTTKVVLAVSGGGDSTALLYAMHALKAADILKVSFICAHVNHQLRGADADSDEGFVVAEASSLGFHVITRRVDIRSFARDHKLSIETAARQCRIKILMDIAKTNGCDRIATAHQKNDSAETVLHRLIRGTGFRGLGGIWPKRAFGGEVTFIRPMLCVTREEVIDYLQTRNLTWQQDHTNNDCTYRRNFIRHRLLPVLQQDCSEPLVETISELAQATRRFYSRICERADDIWPSVTECAIERVALNLEKFQALSPPLKIELIRRCLDHLGCGQRDLTRRHYERIVHMAEQDVTGGSIELPGKYIVQNKCGNLIFSRKYRMTRKVAFSPPVQLNILGQTTFGEYLILATIFRVGQNSNDEFIADKTRYVERFDLEKVKLPLSVRLRKSGDRFIPLGQSREKKVGKFLTAQHVPRIVREKVLLVEDREKILWVWPVRISEQAKVTPATRQILQLQITESADQ